MSTVSVGPGSELLVVSDTHGDVEALCVVFAWAARRGVDTLAFLGDGLPDLARASERTGFRPACRAVRGNGDSDPNTPFQRTVDFAGRRFLLVHGHMHGVMDGFDSLVFAARAANAEAALYGHSHIPFAAEYRGVLLLNPGSPSRPRGGREASFATVACPVSGAGPLSARHWRIDGSGAVRAYEIAF